MAVSQCDALTLRACVRVCVCERERERDRQRQFYRICIVFETFHVTQCFTHTRTHMMKVKHWKYNHFLMCLECART